MPIQPTPSTNTNAVSGPAAHAAAIDDFLKDRWVVMIVDPDAHDWSPWSVVANNKCEAIAQARADWIEWSEMPGPAEVLKVYRRSWIGGIA